MSFYTYYGKVKDELLVAILPSGTVQPNDSIYIYTQKKFSSYTARTVTNTDDGDRFTFKDDKTSFEGVSKNGYKNIHLSIKAGDSHLKAELTRQYEQPSSGKHLTNHPKVWTGVFDFHQWAKDEAIIIVAPKGLGVGRPVVAIWQWTKDIKGTPNTLSYATSTQEADNENSGTSKFYFSQNGYYTLNCQIDSANGGLKVTVKSPTNPDSVLQPLTLSAKVDLGERHKLSPPKGIQQNISLNCSLPQEKPALKRISRPLPFPADIIETLSYSAAYVDQAAHMAKYAISQYDKLDYAYHEIEARLDQRAEQVTGLKKEVLELREKNHKVEKDNESLERLLKQVREDATKREADLQRELEKTQAELRKTTGYLRAEQALNKKLREYIDEDKCRDLEREREVYEQDLADANKIAELQAALAAEKNIVKKLEGKIIDQKRVIDGLNAELDVEKEKVSRANDRITELEIKLQLAQEKRKELEASLDASIEKHKAAIAERDAARIELETARNEIKSKLTIIEGLELNIADQKASYNLLDQSYENEQALRRKAEAYVGKLEAAAKQKTATATPKADIKTAPVTTVTEITVGQ